MPQFHFYVSEPVARWLKERARSEGVAVSRYLAKVIVRDIGGGWPEGYFERVVGAWKGEPLERPPQGELETRESL